MRTYLTDSPAAILRLLDRLDADSHRVIKYEELVSRPDERASLADWLDWPMDGDPARHLESLYKREREVLLHGSEVTQRSLLRQDETRDPRAIELAAWAHAANPDFQQRFGYGVDPLIRRG